MRRSMAALGAALAVALAAGTAAAQDKLKICFVYVGPHNDGGWSEGHEHGRLLLQEELGDRVETSYVENVPEGPDAERAIQRLARSGCGLVFTTSFGFMDPTIKVAEQFPDVKFEHATGFKTADNVTTYNARFYEGRYIIGQIAAKVSESGVAGYIASFPIPEVVMGINAFMLGAQSINPDFQVKIVWVNSWFDPAKEADAAKALFDQGADIVTQHTDSPAPLQIAEERGLHGFGQASDMIKFAPNAQYTAIVDNWAPHYIKSVQSVVDGTWKSQDIWAGIADGDVLMAPYTNLPDDVAAAAEELEQKIASGEFHPFTGPIYDQAGVERYAEGVIAPDGDLLGMNWYVKGVDDQLPQ
ncbi:MAG TPA: BMP family ABC transporter substrate-binding protein [Methylomirabilota bacterium]|nr:BMP family ABC transporter substrate-binding protein [Methylomirabilota bacterium]